MLTEVLSRFLTINTYNELMRSLAHQGAKCDDGGEGSKVEEDGGGDTLKVEGVLKVTHVPGQTTLHVQHQPSEQPDAKRSIVKRCVV